jgi:hypothetical protein
MAWPTSRMLIVGVEGVELPRAVERALRKIDVGAAEDVPHVFHAQSTRGERLRIDLDANGRLLLAADADLADARDLRDFRQQNVFCVSVHRRQRQGFRRQRQNQNRRVGRIHFPDRRRVRHVGRKVWARRVDRREHVDRSTIDGLAEIELRRHRDETERAG